MTRHGKIARLPHELREQLNTRLHDGESARSLLEWLNGLPAVQAVLAAHFGGAPLTAQNLSAWRQGGHADWLRLQELRFWLRHLSEEAASLAQAAGGASPATLLAPVLAATLGRSLHRLDGPASADSAPAQALLALTRELARLRRCDVAEERLRFDRERWATEQAAAKAQAAEDHARALRKAALKARVFPDGITNFLDGFGPMPNVGPWSARPASAPAHAEASPPPPPRENVGPSPVPFVPPPFSGESS
jgi:hypothetical protein